MSTQETTLSSLTAILNGLGVLGALHGEFTRGESWEGIKKLFVKELQGFDAEDLKWAFEQEFKKFPAHPNAVKALVRTRERQRREAEDRAFRANLSAQARAPRERTDMPYPLPKFSEVWAWRSRRLREAEASGAGEADIRAVVRQAREKITAMRRANDWPVDPQADQADDEALVARALSAIAARRS